MNKRFIYFIPFIGFFYYIKYKSNFKNSSFVEKVSEILEGWKNLVWENPKVEKVAKTRLDVCAGCILRSDYPEPVKLSSVCTGCGCNIEAKVRCVKCVCPEKKWGTP